MNLRITFSIFLFSIGFLLSLNGSQPNIIIILTDDMGYGDVGTFGGNPDLTPNLDKMAANGASLHDFYVPQPVCSPSRAGLLTGVNPSRLSIFHVFFPNAKRGLNRNEVTLAACLKKAGYDTAMYGKWHLGDAPEFNPVHFGFDEFYGYPYSNDMWPHGDARPGLFPPLPLYEGMKVINPDVTEDVQKEMTKLLTERTVQFIKKKRNNPFFVYLPHPMPHRPIYASEEFEGKSGLGLYADVIMELDWSLGEIRKALKETGQADNTLLVFTSDNGPWLRFGTHGGSSGKLREGKLTVFEGGVRVPTIAEWPDVIPAGNVVREPAISLDWMPTILNYIGQDLPEAGVDGKDILPLLKGEPGAKSPHDIIPFYFQENELQAVRSGRWKLVLPHHALIPIHGKEGVEGRAGPEEWVTQKLALYDMWQDPGETKDLSASHPEVIGRILNMVQDIRGDLGDTLEGYPGPGRRPVGHVSDVEGL